MSYQSPGLDIGIGDDLDIPLDECCKENGASGGSNRPMSAKRSRPVSSRPESSMSTVCPSARPLSSLSTVYSSTTRTCSSPSPAQNVRGVVTIPLPGDNTVQAPTRPASAKVGGGKRQWRRNRDTLNAVVYTEKKRQLETPMIPQCSKGFYTGLGWKQGVPARNYLHPGRNSSWTVEPKSPSMLESSLHCSANPEWRESKAVSSTTTQLEKDAARPGMSRFNVAMPASGQHLKYCQQNPPKRQYPLGVAFAAGKLWNLFQLIDKDKSGYISQCELIEAIRERPYLFRLFQMMGKECLLWKDNEDKKATGRDEVNEDKKVTCRDEVYLMKSIIKSVDTDRTNKLEWPEFLTFFKRSGLLAVIETRPELNQHPCSFNGLAQGKCRYYDRSKQSPVILESNQEEIT